ncbi:MAG: hypothetical protein KKD44_26385 [Proteobacteria bacterium]|nr:hypothetical protein [Pseudomonadota bacterium]
MDILPTGQIAVYRMSNLSIATLLGTVPASLVLDVWTRLDLLLRWSTGAGAAGSVRVFLGKQIVLSMAVPQDGNGLGIANSRHLNSKLGNDSATANVLELDIDDWMNAEIPNIGGVESFLGIDWLSGSHMQRIGADAFAAGHSGAWVGDWRSVLQNPPAGATGGLTSSTSEAAAAITTHVHIIDSVGAVAMVTGVYGNRAGVANGTLGYSLAGAAPVMAGITESAVPAWKSVLYHPSGLVSPPAIFPVELVYQKAASADLATVRSLMGVVEFLGVWGIEDADLTAPQPAPQPSIHNAPYPSVGVRTMAEAAADMMVVGGIYTGDAFGQDVLAPLQAHWW